MVCPVPRVLAGKENPKTGADNQTDEADHDNHQHSNPAARGDGRNQRLGRGNNGFHRRDGSLDRHLCRNHRRPGRNTGRMGGSPGSPGRGLGCPLGGFGRLLVVLILALAVFSAVLMDLLAVFTVPLAVEDACLMVLRPLSTVLMLFLPRSRVLTAPRS